MMETKETFIVWRRSDGYVNATCNRHPVGGTKDTFEILGEFTDWEEAKSCIIAARKV